MLEQVEEQHKEDEERFKKLQVQDTSNLNDKIDQLTVRFSSLFHFKKNSMFFIMNQMSVASLSAHTSIERSHEVANECRKLNKALKECQESSQTYNNRERLLGLAVTNVSAFQDEESKQLLI